MANEQRTMAQNQPWTAGTAGRAGNPTSVGQRQLANRENTGSGSATGLMDQARDVASDVAEMAQEWASDIAQGAETAYTITRDTVISAEESLESFIRRRPIESVLIAFGVGCLAGCAMSRR